MISGIDRCRTCAGLLTASLVLGSQAIAEQATVNSKDHIIGDREINAPALGYHASVSSSQVGGGGATDERSDRNVVIGYTLPTLSTGTTLETAYFKFEITHSRDTGNDDPSLDVYLLDTSNPDGSGTNFFYHGASDPAADVEFVGRTYIDTATTNSDYADDMEDRIFPVTGSALTLLQSFYGGDHVPDQTEAFIRFNLSDDPLITEYNRYCVDLGSSESELYVSGVAVETAAIDSKDSIVGRRQASAPALDYYPDDARDESGVSGSGGSLTRNDRNPVLGYSLPTLPYGTSVSNAFLSFEITYTRDHNNDDPSLNVYLLDAVNPDGSGTNYFYQGPSNTTADAKFIDSTYIAEGTTGATHADDVHDRTYELSGDALDLLKSFYGGDHTPEQAEAFFRFNMDIIMPGIAASAYERYDIDLGNTESSLQIVSTYPPTQGTMFYIH